jgi:putative hydrolase of HD superfamily
MKETQQQIFNFITMTQKLAEVKRSQHYQKSDRLENDLEHGYQLTMLARMVIDYLNLELNKDLVIKYALVHDMMEVYAGDTLFTSKDVENKQEREEKAVLQLESEFEKTDMRAYIHEYHEKANDEAKFVYALDKLIPEYNIFLGDRNVYKHFNISREALAQHMRKAYIFEPLKPLTDDLIAILYQHDERF